MNKIIKNTCFLFLLNVIIAHGAQKSPVNHNVLWETPSQDENGSMPIGNGDIGANVWVEENGDFLFYISKTDAISENAVLLKLGKVRVKLTPNPFMKGANFKQELDIKEGCIKISASNDNNPVDIYFWVDANNPVIRITGSSAKEIDVQVIAEHWRTKRTKASVKNTSYSGLKDRNSKGRGFPYPIFVEPDTICDTGEDSLLWYHRNKKREHSVWEDTLKVQGIGDFVKQSKNPLLNRTFGVLLEGDGLKRVSSTSLKSNKKTKSIDISIYPLTAQTETADEWINRVKSQKLDYSKKTSETHFEDHKNWWAAFNDRSWIQIEGKPGSDAHTVSRGYALQNWISACGGRGNLPIKFNGTIFTVNTLKQWGPDFRSWGSAYWWQNTRLAYWPMLTAGNYDMMLPLFKMYADGLSLRKYSTKKFYKYDGAYFPETMYFWGTYRNEDYGWKLDEKRHPDKIRGQHTQYEWQGGIELTSMMLEYYEHTGDKDLLNNTLLPFAKEIVAFYDNRYKRNEKNKLVIFPANALEDVFGCINPTPEVAGLRYILPQLAQLSKDPKQKESYLRFLAEIPPLEMDIGEEGQKFILPANKNKTRRSNCEKPECYAIFPYRLYGVGLPDLNIGKETFKRSPKDMRGQARSNGWVQDPIFAACIGDTADAKQLLVPRAKHIHKESRFPGFWAPTYAWVPNQDHGGVNMIALQKMILQTEANTDKIHLLAAWPKDWDVKFKLHAPKNTVIQGEVKNGKLINLQVTPASRKKDVEDYLDSGL